jgi:glutamyl-tRNA synthetase
MHIGNLRTALYAYLLAKSNNGVFILRIEDTDRERFLEDTVDVIYDTLRKTGLMWDEGPFVGGEHGPYIQSERKDSYREYADLLLDSGKAYRCFCTKQRLLDLKGDDKNNMYDRACSKLSDQEIRQNLDAGISYVIRQKMPPTGITKYDDLVYGTVQIENAMLEDQILIKSDGLPTYNFANVVDDHLMGITHIIRGNEYLVSTPKYNLLYEAFGWEIPKYIHLPLIMKSPTEKLSKRTGSASFQDLMNEGFLPEAVINYIALLGWSPGDTREIFSLAELIKAFDLKHINKSPSIFDRSKLEWMNSEYFKAMDEDTFYRLSLPYLESSIKNTIDVKKISALLRTRVSYLSQIEEMTNFFDSVGSYSTDIYIHKKMKTDLDISYSALTLMQGELKKLDDFSNDTLYTFLSELASNNGLKNSQLLWPLRTALTGKPASPGGATELAEIFGKTETLKRINAAVDLLASEKG